MVRQLVVSRMEFIDGEIVVQADPPMPHDVPGRVFVRHVPEPFEAWSNRAIRLGPDDKPRPDAVIIRAGDWSEETHELPASSLLAVVEVVSTGRASIRRDYQDKFLKYQDAGIPVYVLDTNHRYTETERGAYGEPIPFPSPMGFSIPTTTFHAYPTTAV